MSDAQAAAATENGVPSIQEKVEDIGFKVFAGNLAYTTTDDGLRAFFAPVEADIISAQVIQRGTRSAGYGFVALKTAEAAQKAVELLDKKQLDSREVIVEVAKPSEQKDKEKKEKKAKRRPGRRGAKAVPGEVTDAEANGEAKADASGTEGAAKPKKKKTKAKKPKKEGEATSDAPAADGAAAPEKREKKPRKPKAPKVPRAPGEDPAGEPSKTMCFVANLGFTTDDAGLEAIFTDAGLKVTSARVVRRRWGQPRKSKGFGFVELADEEEQKKAVAALDNKEIGGRVLTVRVAVNTPREEGADAKEPEAVVIAS
jgi:RNA recognition motif-containing protein